LLDGGEFVESSTIWEISRICAVPSECPPFRNANGLSPTLSELIVGIVEVGLMVGLTQIVAVFDARIYRVIRAAGCDPQLIGKPQRIGDTMSYVGVFDTGNSPLATIRRAVGIQGSVLAPLTPERIAA
jgi:acyl homoserine lactone synthase